MNKTKICISPIDWGLGHATRCIPLIQALEKLNYQVFIATEGYHEAILREALPNACFLHLRGYRIKYAKIGMLLPLAIFFQIPQIIYNIFYEYRWLQKMQKELKFDLIISDNRFGFYHKNIPSVFITHQLNFQMPFEWATRLFQKIQYAWFNRFTACWIPDMEGENNLSGKLANTKLKPHIPIWYMGCLSRLYQYNDPSAVVNNKPIIFLGIVSGPEPQRSLFENLLWTKGNQLNLKFTVVAGTPEVKEAFQQNENASKYPHLSGADLVKEINRAEYIICRGGYTTLMELIPFEKKLILIPTPGQTEQILLGKTWQEKKWALCYHQNEFKLSVALNEASNFNYAKPPFVNFSITALETALKQLNL
jgi:UDP:flavonoid glycosyltransferase YjiC (YdhE family)